ncbi:MAG: DUF3352 domain-containing protein, partial [Tepidisphaeraceae bacterium]
MRRPYIAAVAIAVLLCPLAARAQPLADRVPADAIVYLGWAGAQTPVPGYAGSHLQVVIDNSKIPELGSRFLPQIFQKFAEKEPDAAEPLRIAQALWATTWKHPTALFFAGVDTSDPKNIAPRLGFICSAGADSAAMKKEIDDLLVAAANAPFPVRAVDADGLVGVVVGYDDPAKALASQGGGAIAKAAGFASAMKQVQAEPVLIAYVDFEKLINMAESHVQAEADEHTKQMVPKVIDALGIRGLKRVICTAGFDGQDWMTQTFVEAPAPRKGMLAMFDGKPVSPELLKAIPADATFVATGRFDPAKLVNTVRAVAAEIDPHLAQMIDQGLGAAQLALAKNLVTEIFEPLGEDWALYCSPSIAGNGVLGVVVVNRLDDPAKAQASLPTAAINLSNWLGVVMKETEAEVEIRGRLTKIDDLDIYYVGLPIVAPSWAIKDGFLYMGLYT